MVITKIMFTIFLGFDILVILIDDEADENVFISGIDVFLKSWMITVLWVYF